MRQLPAPWLRVLPETLPNVSDLRSIDLQDHELAYRSSHTNIGCNEGGAYLPGQHLIYGTAKAKQHATRMPISRAMLPNETLQRVYGYEVLVTKISFNGFLEPYYINPFFPDVVAELGAPPRVAEATDVPNEHPHLDDAVSQADPPRGDRLGHAPRLAASR